MGKSGPDLEETLVVLKPVTAAQPDAAGIRMKWIEEEVK
jgi:hypothetical protein